MATAVQCPDSIIGDENSISCQLLQPSISAAPPYQVLLCGVEQIQVDYTCKPYTNQATMQRAAAAIPGADSRCHLQFYLQGLSQSPST